MLITIENYVDLFGGFVVIAFTMLLLFFLLEMHITDMSIIATAPMITPIPRPIQNIHIFLLYENIV